jgi:hypothetical protein
MLLALAGCGPEPANPDIPSERVEPGPVAAKRLREVLERDGSVIFRSFDGRWIGTDGDTDLQLSRGGKGNLIHFSVGIVKSPAAYVISDDGRLTVSLEDGKSWPAMELTWDRRSLVLKAVDPPGARPAEYWAFREIPASGRNRVHD